MQHYAISAVRDGFRRGGRAWSREAVVVAADELTDEQLAALEADPNITVTPCAPEGPQIESSVETAELGVADARGLLVGAAIRGLEPGDKGHWTSTGLPATEAIEAASGLKTVSAAERDEAWARHQASR